MERYSSGIPTLDDAVGGLLLGDNIVWLGGDEDVHLCLQRAFLSADPTARKVVVTTHLAPATLLHLLGVNAEVIDARAGRPHSDVADLEQAILQRAASGARFVLGDLDVFVKRLGAQRSVGFFSRVCPQLFNAGAIAYWRGTTRVSGPTLDEVHRVTQCVFDVSGGHLRIVKAEGRRRARGQVWRLSTASDGLQLVPEAAIGLLAEGIRQVRNARHLSQSDLSRLAGVSPSAISQVEAGHRGLSLETVLKLSQALGIGLDDLLCNTPDSDYVLARRDRQAPRLGLTPLIDDTSAGLRAYLVHLGPGQQGEPPRSHKGPELVVVATGLLQIDLGTDAAVVRAGDAVLATRVPIRGWRNLLSTGPARLFWILRDP